MPRPNTVDYFLQMARLVASRGTCYRRQVGCVLVDRDNRVIATGYNGVPSGEAHCNQVEANGAMLHLCPGAMSASGTNLQGCNANHAELNALVSCRNPEDIVRAYITTSPCRTCVGYLLNTPCVEVIFEELYPHPEARDKWIRAGRRWTQVGSSTTNKE